MDYMTILNDMLSRYDKDRTKLSEVQRAELIQKCQRINDFCRLQGGQLISRQVIALVVVDYLEKGC